MSQAIKSHRLLLMEIRLENDIVLCRQRARQFAEAMGFSPQDQIRIATAVSEVARNAFQYAGGGKVEFAFETEPRFSTPGRPQQSLRLTVSDSGPGISNLDEILGGAYRSKTGLGLGILGSKRLLDRLEVATSSAGTTVTMRQVLPLGNPAKDAAQVQAAVDDILRRTLASPLDEMQMQNQALMRAIDDARLREEEIKRINEELAETNGGVLALYDELETLHRVSVLMGSQLELKALIQSMVDVTTELTNADVGTFFFQVEGGDGWALYATSGPDREMLPGIGAVMSGDFFGPEVAKGNVLRVSDVHEVPADNSAARFARGIGNRFQARSCLIVPIPSSNTDVFGAMVFASREFGRFTERSERIVSSIASQAVIGIEKSRLYQAVKASSEAKDQFLAMLSHELRTPLNPVLAIVSSWHGDPRVPVELRDEVAVVARNIRLEARLIDDLLDFNKLINGKLQIDHALVDLHSVVDSTVEICREDLESRDQVLTVTLAAQSCTVAGDAARLQQVLWNLLKNAIKFTPHRGEIAVETSNPEPGRIRVTVSDNGPGIDPTALGRIFGAFEQGKPQVVARFGGLGLGLAIAKTFVDRHNGTISAFSEGEGLGSRFTIELPVSIASAPATTGTIPAAPDSRARDARILLVEDHTDTLETLTRLLKRKGYTVATAPSGAEARRQFALGAFDLIISDLGLPDCSGLELLVELRAISTTPAIALSGYGMETDLINSRAAGFDAHLTKPIDFELLVSAVDQILNQTPRS